MATPHDTLFRLAFGRPANARDVEKKFGALPPKLVARVKRARIETLDRWFDQFVTASVLDEVLAER